MVEVDGARGENRAADADGGRLRALGWLALLALTAGCSQPELLLTVELRTDFAPGREFTLVETELHAEGADPHEARIVRRPAATGEDFLEGARVFEVTLDEPGGYLIATTLRAADGAQVASRTTRIRIDASLAMTTLLTRSCAGVSCPRLDDPAGATSCLGGRCVDPECSAERPEGCGEPECASSSDCAPEPACAQAFCADEGYCLQRPSDEACGAGQQCSLADGCVPLVSADAGVDAGVDAGPAAEPDASVVCVPRVETCDGEDDDCDGLVDETFDRSTDARHCGACDNACDSWERCSGGGCALDQSRLSSNYCPSDAVSRATAAVFLVRASRGPDFVPPPAVGVFSDVTTGGPHAPFIEQLYRDGIINGCTATTYCPMNAVSRAQIAVMLVRVRYGASYTPPPAVGVFSDVAAGSTHAPYIEQLYRDGIVGGCTASTYCPTSPLSRSQMAVLLLRSAHGGSYTPPPPTGALFDDVPASHFSAAWIEQLAREGITTGC